MQLIYPYQCLYQFSLMIITYICQYYVCFMGGNISRYLSNFHKGCPSTKQIFVSIFCFFSVMRKIIYQICFIYCEFVKRVAGATLWWNRFLLSYFHLARFAYFDWIRRFVLNNKNWFWGRTSVEEAILESSFVILVSEASENRPYTLIFNEL